MNTRPTLVRFAICATLSTTAIYPSSSMAAAPTLNLFPTSVVENLQASADSAKAMENNMESIVAQMDNQLQLYNDSKCEANDADAGCSQIKKGISSTYMKMLTEMEAQLPTMKSAMQSTATKLGKNIRTELGKKMTTLDLQRVIQGKKGGTQRIRKVSGKRQGRMSKMLNKYHSMITLSSHQGQNQAMLAAEIYSDSVETLDYINLIQMEINQSKVLGGIGTIWNGEPSEQMMATVGSVKALLYGEEESGYIPEMTTPAIDPANDDSDWTID